MQIDKKKGVLVSKYDKEPTICYYYYLYNVVDYCGETIVRESFKSIQGQGYEVIVGCYLPTDNTEKIAKEYGFKVVKIDKDIRNNFPESKIRNKIIHESKSNFLIPININVVYESNLTTLVKNWINTNNITKNFLKIRYNFQDSDGSIGRRMYGFSCVFYKPYLIDVRGYDERTSYAAGSQKYGVCLLRDLFKLKVMDYNSNMFHRFHNHIKMPMLRKFFPNKELKELRVSRGKVVATLINNLNRDYSKNIGKVKNSYW